MKSTLNLLYDYARDLEFLIKKAGELAEKSILKGELSKIQTIESFSFEDLSIRETDYLVSLSRILADYGFAQTYESFENACSLLLADYNYAEEMVDMATEKLKKSASRLYTDETGESFLCRTPETSGPWALLVEMLTESDGEAVARRKFYLKRIAGLASAESLASAMFYGKTDEIVFNLSPFQLEMDFIMNDGILPEILSSHAKTDFC